MNATQEELVEAEGIGPERAEAIAEWFRDDDNRRLVAELRELGLRFEVGDDEKPVEGPLTGNAYVITGTLESMTRNEAQAALEELGAKVSDSVSSKTTGVVVGEEPGKSKLTKAEKAGVPLLTEADLLALLAPTATSPPPAITLRVSHRRPNTALTTSPSSRLASDPETGTTSPARSWDAASTAANRSCARRAQDHESGQPFCRIEKT